MWVKANLKNNNNNKMYFIYLKGTYRDGDTEKDFPPSGSLLKWMQ